MVNQRLSRGPAPFLSLRMIEWSLVAALIAVLALVFTHKVRVVQGQAEIAAVHATLGNLRTAFVLDHLRRSMPSGAGAALQSNPFELLERRQPNYFGEASAAQALAAPAGSWVFDAACICVGYLPMNADWLQSPSGDLMAWYQISGAPGPLQLSAKEAYRWQGSLMN